MINNFEDISIDTEQHLTGLLVFTSDDTSGRLNQGRYIKITKKQVVRH